MTRSSLSVLNVRRESAPSIAESTLNELRAKAPLEADRSKARWVSGKSYGLAVGIEAGPAESGNR